MMLSVKEVSYKLKISEQQVRSLLRNGDISASMVGKQWVIQEEALDKYVTNSGCIIAPDDRPRVSTDLPDVIALSFFSGAMGLDIGMKNAGIHALLACEFDKTCRKTIVENDPDIALIGDINHYTSKQILEMARIPKDTPVDIIFGGPPCQAFSTAGARRGFNDSRGNVFLKYIDIVTEIRPRYVVIENVRGLLSAPFPYTDDEDAETFIQSDRTPIKGGALLHIMKRLREAGYTVSFNLYNAANYGAPQIRERVVIIGSLNGKRVPFLHPTHSENAEYGLQKWRTLSDAFCVLPSDTIHHYVNFPEKRLVYYRMLKEGQYWKDLPPEIAKEAMGNVYNLGGGRTGFYRRLSFQRPSPTLVTHPAMPATDLCHPTEDRPLSVEEYKCIQEFPQTWKICGDIEEQYKQIGNAVPIKLGEAIGKAILDHMHGIDQAEIPGFHYSRYLNTDNDSWEAQARKNIISDECRQMSIYDL